MNGFRKYWIFALIGILAISSYPLYMGYRVIYDMISKGAVPKDNFPKYIIPYTPIAISIIVAVLFMPLLFQYIQKHRHSVASLLSLCVFFLSEFLFESKVIVSTTVRTTLESWQMFMCYIPPDAYETRTWKAIDILIGDYSPTFKLHFYLISVVLIIGIVNCLYGFGQMILTKDYTRRKALIMQSICTALFLGLCLLACFTAFFRDGELVVSALSAFLMGLFFVVLGITAGIFAGSFLIGRTKAISVVVPAIIASCTTLAMYIGEMFLLSGHLYLLGNGFLFDPLPGIILAPIDVCIILLAGCITAVICTFIDKQPALS